MATNIGKTYEQGIRDGHQEMARAAAPIFGKQKRDAEFWRRAWLWSSLFLLCNQAVILILLLRWMFG